MITRNDSLHHLQARKLNAGVNTNMHSPIPPTRRDGTLPVFRGLYCITPEYARGVQYERMVRSACAGGADVIQFRTKNLDVTGRLKTGRNLRRITSKYKVPFIVNDDLPLALYINADGVHLGQDDLPLFVVRKMLKIIGRKNFFVGVSTHSLKDAVQAEKEGASYISVGPIYFTPIKSHCKPVTAGLLSRVKKRVKVPVIAIGGINHTNIDEVLNAGADGAAVIRAAAGTRDITKSVKKLKLIILRSLLET